MQATQNGIIELSGGECTLSLTTCNIDDEEQTSYTTYGILVKDQLGMVLLQHQDISTDRAYVEKFIQTCAIHDVSPVHIMDVLEDYLD